MLRQKKNFFREILSIEFWTLCYVYFSMKSTLYILKSLLFCIFKEIIHITHLDLRLVHSKCQPSYFSLLFIITIN